MDPAWFMANRKRVSDLSLPVSSNCRDTSITVNGDAAKAGAEASKRLARIRISLLYSGLEDPSLETLHGEFGRICYRHDRHHAGLHGIGDHQVGGFGDAAGHVQADHQQAGLAHLADCL